MYYSSRIGCVIYLDDVIGGLRLCEPTLLFLLGLDAVTTPSSDYIIKTPIIDPVTGKPAIDKDTGEIQYEDDKPNEYLLKNLVIHKDVVGEEIFKRIIDTVGIDYSILHITDDEVVFDLKGLKSFMNSITGTGSDRIVPFIFHEHEDISVLGDIDADNRNNDLSDKMKKVFDYAGYDVADTSVHILGKSFIEDESTINAIDKYNEDLLAEHNIKKFYRHIYKILDYKSMYSYALGVLFGCKCLGFSDNDIWRSDPSSWYDGEYTNLVSLAHTVFKFHYRHPIAKIDRDHSLFKKYKSIQINKIWNFDNTQYNIKQDEICCTVLSVEDNEIVEKPIIYSRSAGPQKPIPGSYLSDENVWVPLDSGVICDDPKRGIVHNCDKPVKRYIGHNEVEIKRAYQYSNHKYLSPTNEEISFISDGNIGWVNFDYDSYKQLSDEYSPLTFSEKEFEDLQQSRFGNVVSKIDGSVVGYYFSDVTDDIHLYGIMNNMLHYTEDGSWDFSNIDDLFTSLLSDVDFETYYYTELPEGYTVVNYYDLDHLIALCINDENPEYYYDGLEDAPLVDKGYTLTPSIPLDAYIYDSELNTTLEFNLRYNEDLDSYWSSEWDPKEWLPTLDDSIYINTGNVISLYRNTELLFEDTTTYNNNTFKYEFICNTLHTEYNLRLGFLNIDDLYNLGITDHECEIIETDPNGDPLVDEYGNFVVWRDPVTSKYWNGYVSAWQDSIPVRNNTTMYDTSTGTVSNISDNEIDHEITLSDGTVVTYDEFYSYPYCRGVIRDNTSFKLFNPNVSSNILQCYFDYKFGDSGRYCVPGGVFERWMTFDEVHDKGYWFVSNESTLYDGDSLVQVIVDNDPTD